MKVSRRHTAKGLLLNFLLFSVSASIALVLAEVAVRIIHPRPPATMDAFRLTRSSYYQPDSLVGWVPRPNVQGNHNQEGSFTSTFRTNATGQRDKDYPLARTPNVQRVVVFGDSFTWGWGVNDGELYPDILETLLPGTEVINFGVTAYGTRQEIDYFARDGVRYKPDVLVLGWCLNDVFRSSAGSGAAPLRAAVLKPRDSVATETYSPVTRFKRFLRSNSALYQLVIDQMNTNKAVVRVLVALHIKGELVGFDDLDVNLMPAIRTYPPILERSWEENKSELLELKALAAANGMRLVIAALPSAQSIIRGSFEEAIGYTEFGADDFDLDKPYRLMEEFGRANGIEVLNPLDAFRRETANGTKLFLPFDMHFTKEGHAVFARELATLLKARTRAGGS